MPAKFPTRHPYAAIDHRVIDSPAFADMSSSACKLLLLLARQLTKTNNGHLQASFKWCSKRGFGSEHTLKDAIASLIAHGFIYRTRSHGANKTWARYAVTWLSITDKKELFLAGFNPCAWREWEPPGEESSPQKVQDRSSKKCSFTPENPAEAAGTTPAETADYEVIPSRATVSEVPATEEMTSDGFSRSRDDAPSTYWDSDRGEIQMPPPESQSLVRESARETPNKCQKQ